VPACIQSRDVGMRGNSIIIDNIIFLYFALIEQRLHSAFDGLAVSASTIDDD
jgi:hypothetical protein